MRRPLASVAAAAALGAVAVACSSAPAKSSEPACARFQPPRRLTNAPLNLPTTFALARLSGVVVDEAVVGRDGAVSEVRLAWTDYRGLAPFAERSILDSRFASATIEGNPVASRVLITTRLGQASTVPPGSTGPKTTAYDTVWAHVADGQSREARWQLAGSVDSLTVSVRLGTRPEAGGEIVARGPAGGERVLLKLDRAATPIDARRTVKTDRFLWHAGDYRIELRADGKTLAWTTVTIADDYTRAIVNACAAL